MESEALQKTEQLDFFELTNPEFLEEARRGARHCCHNPMLGRNYYGIPHTVTADFVRSHMQITTGAPNKNNLMGSVFRKGFVRVGYVASKAEGHHACMIGLWTLPKYEKVVRDFIKGSE